MKKPHALKKGSKIAVISPSWGGPATFPHKYEAGLTQLKNSFDVEIVEMPNTRKPADWLHLNPKARADDLMQAFEDTSIEGIIASIGGDDAIRLLPFIDLNVIAANPKVFMGYSDTTTLHFACMKAGLTSFYGPSIMAGFGENGGLFPYMEDAVRKTIFTPQQTLEIEAATEWTVAQLDFGHTDPMCVLPYGIKAQIDCTTKRLTLLESGCSV